MMFHLRLLKRINPAFFINKNHFKLTSTTSNLLLKNDEKKKFIEEKFSYLKDYDLVYKLNKINILTTLSRLKIYQTMFTVTLGITSTYLYLSSSSSISLQPILISNAAAVVGLISLVLVSKLLSKVICMIYLHKNGNDVIISHINFFSRRNNIFTTVDNITPIYSSIREIESTFSKFELNDHEGNMYFSLKSGSIIDTDKFKKVIRILH